MDDDSRPVTRGELREELARFEIDLDLDRRFSEQRREISLEIAQAMNYTVETLTETLTRTVTRTLTDHVDRWGDRLSAEIGRASLAGAEENRREPGAVHDEVRGLSGRVGVLERELDEHRRDDTIHVRARPGSTKRGGTKRGGRKR